MPGTIGGTDGFLFYRRQVPCPISHIRLSARVRQLEHTKCPEEYVRRSLTMVEARYIGYNGWYGVRKEDVLVGKDGGSVLSENFLVRLVNGRRHERAEHGLPAPAGQREAAAPLAVTDGSQHNAAGIVLLAESQHDAAESAAKTQSLNGVSGRYCVLHAAINAVQLYSPSSAEVLAALLIKDSKLKHRCRQYEDLPLARNSRASALWGPSLGGLLKKTFDRSLFELQPKGRVVTSLECSPSALLIAQPPGVYVAILEDKSGDTSHAVALDLRCATAATIWDASDIDPEMPLTDANLQRCCTGVRCVGCHRLALILHNPAKQKRPAAVAYVTGSEKAAKERARKAAQRRRKRQRQPTGDGAMISCAPYTN